MEKIFFGHWSDGVTEFEFAREEIESYVALLHITAPKNLGDIIYSFRFRQKLPQAIMETQPSDKEWIIEGAGRARYRFRLAKVTRVIPNDMLVCIGVPDATPEVIRAFALGDEQALLAIVRYNRLVDIFLGLTSYSLQNHLRTTVKGVGQIEIDELYIGIDRYGCQYVIPIQAKGGSDQIGVVQTQQDLAFAEEKFPGLRCRPVAAQFMSHGIIALFELALDGEGQVKVVDEKHYKLVPANEIDRNAIVKYR